MKCAFIASFYGPYYSNFVAAMISFDKKMKSEGNTVFYILPKEAENFEWMSTFKKQNSDIYFLEYKPYSFNNLLALKKIFKEENVDLAKELGIRKDIVSSDLKRLSLSPISMTDYCRKVELKDKALSNIEVYKEYYFDAEKPLNFIDLGKKLGICRVTVGKQIKFLEENYGYKKNK